MQLNKDNLALAARQVKLLSRQDYFRNEKELIDLLVRTLVKLSDNEDHLRRMVETWIARTRQALHPADVAGLAAETSHRLALPQGCDVCQGASFIHNEIKGGVERCSCERGRKLAEADVRHKEAEARQAFVGGVP